MANKKYTVLRYTFCFESSNQSGLSAAKFEEALLALFEDLDLDSDVETSLQDRTVFVRPQEKLI